MRAATVVGVRLGRGLLRLFVLLSFALLLQPRARRLLVHPVVWFALPRVVFLVGAKRQNRVLYLVVVAALLLYLLGKIAVRPLKRPFLDRHPHISLVVFRQYVFLLAVRVVALRVVLVGPFHPKVGQVPFIAERTM